VEPVVPSAMEDLKEFGAPYLIYALTKFFKSLN
jgi:hypothetical protein